MLNSNLWSIKKVFLWLYPKLMVGPGVVCLHLRSAIPGKCSGSGVVCRLYKVVGHSGWGGGAHHKFPRLSYLVFV